MKPNSLNRTRLMLGIVCAFVSGALTSVALALPKEGTGFGCGCLCTSSDGAGGIVTSFSVYDPKGYACALFNGKACANLTPEGSVITGKTSDCEFYQPYKASISIRVPLFGRPTIFYSKRPRQ